MSFRQAIIQLGSWSLKAGLWESSYLPTYEIPTCVQITKDGDTIVERKYGQRDIEGGDLIYPIMNGQLVDIIELEYMMYFKLSRKHILVNGLGIKEPLTDCLILFILPACWTRTLRFKILQLIERLDINGVYLAEAPLMAAFGCAVVSVPCVTVDIGHTTTEIAVQYEGRIVPSGYEILEVGGKELEKTILNYLESDTIFQHCLEESNYRELFEKEGILMARALKENGWESSKFIYCDRTFQIGDGLGSCINDLIDRVTSAIFSTIMRVNNEIRVIVLNHVIVTGGCSRSSFLVARLQSSLQQNLYMTKFVGEYQPTQITLRAVPEYYSEFWREATPLAAWFGGGVTAKNVLTDSKNYYTLDDLKYGISIFSKKRTF